MKNTTLSLFLILIVPLFLQAAYVYIWNYDPNDQFIDPQSGDTIDCAYWIETALSMTGHTYTTNTYLPQDLSPYDVVFVTLGFFRC